jgi:hypothetical protein
VRAPEAGTNLQIDLMFFNPEWESNGTVSYTGVLNVLDVHSRYAWSGPIRDKRAKTVKKEFKKIIKEIEADTETTVRFPSPCETRAPALLRI